MKAEPADPRSATGPYLPEKVRYWRERLRTQLSLARAGDLFELFWLIDRLSSGIPAKRAGFEDRFFTANWTPGSPTFIGGWELEALLLEYFTIPPPTLKRKYLNTHAWVALADLVNRLRYIENEQSKRHDPELILEELGRIAYREFGYQAAVPDMLTALRWWSICEEPTLRSHLESTYRLDLRLILRTFFALIGYLDGDPFRLPPPSVESGVGSRFAVDRVFALLSRSLQQHRALARDAILEDVAYRESSLRRFPLVRFEHLGAASSYCAPLRHPLWWRLTSGLYYDFVQIKEFQNLIGSQFEEYVRKLISGTTGWTIRPKTNYRLLGFGPTETPDCVAVNESGLVCMIVECKAVKSTLAAQIQMISQAGIEGAVAQLAKGIVQVVKYRAFLRQAGQAVLDRCANLVVTLDDWMFIGDALTARVFERARELAEREGLRSNIADLDRIVLTSSRHLEELLAHYSTGEVLEATHAALGPLRGYELRSIPGSLGYSAKPRNLHFEREFERLIDRPGFGSSLRGSGQASS